MWGRSLPGGLLPLHATGSTSAAWTSSHPGMFSTMEVKIRCCPFQRKALWRVRFCRRRTRRTSRAPIPTLEKRFVRSISSASAQVRRTLSHAQPPSTASSSSTSTRSRSALAL